MIESLKQEFDKQLQFYLDELPNDNLNKPIKYILSLGGKRLRPLLVVMSARAYGNDTDSAFYAALAVEVFHNFSLMHDDIMDQAPLRRGKETVHSKWDQNTAILSGDAMLIESYKLISRSSDANNLKFLLDLFNQTSSEVCWGQQLDMDFENRSDVDITEYKEMIRLKTAVLLGCALKMGAIIAGAPARDADLIYDFGVLAGIGFQIQDDYLDAFGDPEKFGKQVGGDIIANKKTYLIIRALELAEADLEKELNGIYFENKISDATEKVKRVKSIFRELKVDQETIAESGKYFDRATDCINQLSLGADRKEGFKTFLDMLSVRKY